MKMRYFQSDVIETDIAKVADQLGSDGWLIGYNNYSKSFVLPDFQFLINPSKLLKYIPDYVCQQDIDTICRICQVNGLWVDTKIKGKPYNMLYWKFSDMGVPEEQAFIDDSTAINRLVQCGGLLGHILVGRYDTDNLYSFSIHGILSEERRWLGNRPSDKSSDLKGKHHLSFADAEMSQNIRHALIKSFLSVPLTLANSGILNWQMCSLPKITDIVGTPRTEEHRRIDLASKYTSPNAS